MRKLGDGKTVRLFVPLTEDMRNQFEAVCNGESMASVLRDMIAERIAKSTKPKRVSAEREPA